jgi:predicted nicotinamide N-methyase
MAGAIDDETLAALLDAHAPWRALLPRPMLNTGLEAGLEAGLGRALHAWQAADELALWQALEERAGRKLDPPFFGVAWPGAQALAVALSRRLIEVGGRSVLDVGAGSGVAACAAALAGARRVVAADLDPLAVCVAVVLGARHGVVVEPLVADALHVHGPQAEADPALDFTLDSTLDFTLDFDVILCGDIVYGQEQSRRFAAALARWKSAGRVVLVADSGRPFFDPQGLEERMTVEVDVARGVEGRERRTARIYTLPT